MRPDHTKSIECPWKKQSCRKLWSDHNTQDSHDCIDNIEGESF